MREELAEKCVNWDFDLFLSIKIKKTFPKRAVRMGSGESMFI